MFRRLREWAQARLDEVILRHVQAFAKESAEAIDYERLALHVTTLKEFMRDLKEQVAGELEMDGIAEKVAEHIDARDIAYHIDAEDVASHVEVDPSDMNIDVDDVAAKINYRDLCRCLLAELKKECA